MNGTGASAAEAITGASAVSARPSGTPFWLRAAVIGLLTINVGFFWYSTLVRTRHFNDPDSMNFVDVARNIVAGRGVSQNTLGFNQPTYSIGDSIPAPFVSQSPVAPLAVAAFALVGLEPLDGGVVLSLLCFSAVIALVLAIGWRVYGVDLALLAAAMVASYLPLRYWSQSAMSDPLGLVFVLGGLLGLLVARQSSNPLTWFTAGILVGGAAAVRFALVPLVGLALILVCAGGLRRRWGAATACLAGVAVTMAPVVIWSLSASGGGYLPSEAGLSTNVSDVILAMAGDYADVPGASRTLRPVLLPVVVIAAGLLAFRRGTLKEATSAAVMQRGAWLLSAWVMVYLTFLSVFRSVNHVDRLTTRLVLPAGVVAILIAVVWIARASGARARLVSGAAVVVLAGSLAAEVHAFANGSPFRDSSVVAASPRLAWLARETSADDLIIGDDVVDVTFLLRRTAVVSFSPYPYSQHVTHADVVAMCQAYRRPNARAFLVLRNRLPSERVWQYAFGPFVTDLAFGRTHAYPALTERARLGDGTIFEARCDQ